MNFSSIPLSRLVAYAVVVLLLPVAFLFFTYTQERGTVSGVKQRIEMLRSVAFTKQQTEAANWGAYHHYGNADHFYIDKHLESIPLLQREVNELKRIVEDKNFANDSRINTRLQHLVGKGNQLSFVEGVVQSYPLFQETTETLAHPVEVDMNDIQTLLARIEGVKVGEAEPLPDAPQLLVAEWKMDRKAIYDNHEVFVLHLKLIKREFI